MNSIKSIITYIWQSPSNKNQKLYRLFLGMLWQCYKRTVKLPIVSKLDNGAKFILECNSTNSTGNIYVKTYEAEYIYFLRKNVLKDGLILDIGAHMGLYTLLLNDLFDGGFCFEPSGDTFKALKNNLFLNELIDKFVPVNSAISDSNVGQLLRVHGDYSGVNRIVDASETSIEELVLVPSVSVDSFLHHHKITADIKFIKIDTEGHELKVLQGCTQTLKNNKAVIVLFENSSTSELLKFFESIRYKVFSIDQQGRILSDTKNILGAYNLFAVGSEHPIFAKLDRV